MRFSWLTLVVLLLLFSFREDNNTEILVRDIYHLVNAHRKAVGLRPLAYNKKIETVAMKHSRDMAASRVPFGHEGFDKRSAWLIKKIAAREVGENVARASVSMTAKTIVEGWLNSPGHLKNIEGDYTDTGIGIACKDDVCYYTQLFCRR